ncbi:DUF1272 domain-containing protein [Burkholderia multivorans]|uniref:DUF1272 domain-containing protein n=1 Tax=Burkholderia multivorans TaxID=87883 RepID=UPI000B5A24AE|nr:DUF1272 domain-containing protein [Burkholderia multivorans]
MLELRPSCEHCNAALPPASTQARICSFECTFCATCVDTVLHNVCPNCGGGFETRPVRPTKNWKNGNHIVEYPPTTSVKHRPVESHAHDIFSSVLRCIPPQDR